MHDSNDLSTAALRLLTEQKSTWPMARSGYAALATVQTRTVELGDFVLRLQFNPGRIVSSSAKVDEKTIRQRKCFLCPANLPAEQTAAPVGDDYLVLVNPFPIFAEHFTVPHREHRPQRIAGVFAPLLEFARAMSPRYTVFYNGPKCGASAPDHLHFQAGNRGFMTIEVEYERLKGQPIAHNDRAAVYLPNSIRPFIAIESDDPAATAQAFDAACRALAEVAPGQEEPMMNILTWFDQQRWRTIIFPRARHRPSFYFAEGDARILLSPASVDLGGVCITPVEKDYHRVTADHLRQMLAEVMLPAEKLDIVKQRLRQALQ